MFLILILGFLSIINYYQNFIFICYFNCIKINFIIISLILACFITLKMSKAQNFIFNSILKGGIKKMALVFIC